MVSKGLIFSGSCLPLASGPPKEQEAWLVVKVKKSVHWGFCIGKKPERSDVRFWHKADVATDLVNVRFWG